jgi:hypothetical protein
MVNLTTGDVIELPVGLVCYHNQGQVLEMLKAAILVVVEAKWGRSLAHEMDGYDRSIFVEARALNVDGTYAPEGAYLTFAISGCMRPEFILPEIPNQVLRKMNKVFVAPPATPV